MAAEYTFPAVPFLGFQCRADSFVYPIVTADSMVITTIRLGPGFNIELPFRFGLFAYAGLGYYYGIVPAVNAIRGGNLAVGGGIGAAYSLPKLVSFGLYADYTYNRLLAHTIGITAAVSLNIRLKTKDIGPPLIIGAAEMDPVFPVLHQHYDTSPFGTVTVKNNRDRPIHDIAVDFFIERYMSDPKTCISAVSLGPDESREVPVYALFDSDILEVLESTKVSYKLIMRYVYRGKPYSDEHFDTVTIENRNATVWDDDRKVAAFVNTLDPEVMTFAKIVSSFARKSTYGNLPAPLKSAIAIYEALRVYDIRYAVDAATPFEEFSRNPYIVDYLQFPRQTLQYKGGDCDDLSILYNALLQSASVHTAFITVPGHIYPAVSLDMSPAEARERFSRPEILILDEETGKTWLPLEITALDRDFLSAWELGAREWREAEAEGAAELIPTEEAWQEYQAVWYRPVTASEQSYFVELPDTDSVRETFNRSVRRFVLIEVESQTEELMERIEEDHSNGRLINKLGVIYAKNGMMGEAKKTFTAALSAEPNLYPALVNLGNISYLDGDYLQALKQFEAARNIRPDRPRVMVTLMELYYELGRSAEAAELFTRFSARYPDLAEENRHLSSELRFQTRAAVSASAADKVFWADEEEGEENAESSAPGEAAPGQEEETR